MKVITSGSGSSRTGVATSAAGSFTWEVSESFLEQADSPMARIPEAQRASRWSERCDMWGYTIGKTGLFKRVRTYNYVKNRSSLSQLQSHLDTTVIRADTPWGGIELTLRLRRIAPRGVRPPPGPLLMIYRFAALSDATGGQTRFAALIRVLGPPLTPSPPPRQAGWG